MRVSVWPADAGYKNYRQWMGCKVYVDGELVERVFTADTDLGEVICAKVDERGAVVIEGDQIAEQVIRGRVKLIK